MTEISQQRPAARADYEGQFAVLWRKAYHVAYQILGSSAAAEDVAQEALARAYAWWSRISASPQGWVAKVAYTLAVDQIRRQRNDSATMQAVEEVRPDPKIEERMDLMAALERLPRRQRQVVVLRYLADQSEADTATALRLRVSTVRKHAARGLAALGGLLDPESREG
jgi:RNA polymerase sigma factor (sigma-70 family)